jgi:hypothetical protein
VHSLRGALAAGLITDLIVDEGTARALVALDEAHDAEAVVPVDGRGDDEAAPEVFENRPTPPVVASAR